MDLTPLAGPPRPWCDVQWIPVNHPGVCSTCHRHTGEQPDHACPFGAHVEWMPFDPVEPEGQLVLEV